MFILILKNKNVSFYFNFVLKYIIIVFLLLSKINYDTFIIIISIIKYIHLECSRYLSLSTFKIYIFEVHFLLIIKIQKKKRCILCFKMIIVLLKSKIAILLY